MTDRVTPGEAKALAVAFMQMTPTSRLAIAARLGVDGDLPRIKAADKVADLRAALAPVSVPSQEET